MKINILKTTILTMVLCLMALPANALLYHFSSNAVDSWTNSALTGDVNVETGLNLYRLNVRSGPIYTADQGKVTWGRLFFRFNSDRLGAFTIQDSTHDILDFVYPNTDGQYFTEHTRDFDSGQEEGPQPGVAPVPEPGTLILIGSGLGGLLLYRKRRTS